MAAQVIFAHIKVLCQKIQREIFRDVLVDIPEKRIDLLIFHHIFRHDFRIFVIIPADPDLDPEALKAVHDQVVADLGPCDILVNGAGGNNPRATTDNEFQHEAAEGQKTFFDLDAGGVDFVFKLNFQGTLLPTQVFARDMVEKKNGCILNISSMNAYTPLTKIPAYSGAKAAISNFTQWLAVHFAGSGIRCNAIAPGFLVSNQNRALLFNEDGTPTKRSEKILRNTPMDRFVDSAELLGGVFFLCDEKAASAITGVVLPIDAGFASYSGV